MTNPEISKTIQYHLDELELAKDSSDSRHHLPEITAQHNAILDLGCGIGQTLIALGATGDKSKTLVGVDNEIEPLIYGTQLGQNIGFVNAGAESLPLKSDSLDLVISRVTLPYTNIPSAVLEINRVLKPGGEIWITLHSPKQLINPLIRSVKSISIRGILARLFFLFNGIMFHCFGVLAPHPVSGVYESFQTSRGMRRVLRKSGFTDIVIDRSHHFLITASKLQKQP